mgnify:FL=1
MALIRCPECGEDVSGVANIARSCPICGTPIHLPPRVEREKNGNVPPKSIPRVVTDEKGEDTEAKKENDASDLSPRQ